MYGKPILSLTLGCLLVTIIYYQNANYLKNNQTSSYSGGSSVFLTMGNKNCTELSVLTWNVWFGSQGGWDHPQERWKQVLSISLQKNPDIIGFQECTKPFLDVVNGFSDFKENYVPVNSKPIYSRYFVMIYIKKDLRLIKKKTVKLKTTLDRRCEVATFQKQDAQFHFGTVHIESYVTSPDIREIQMQTIFDHLMKKEKSIQLSFVVGDFNFDDTDKEYEFVKKSPFRDTWPTVNKDEEGFSFETTKNLMNKYAMQMNKEDCTCRLDRVLFRTPSENNWFPLTCELIGTESFGSTTVGDGSEIPLFPSDHFGLFARFIKKDYY